MNINELTIGQAKELSNLFTNNKTFDSSHHPFEVGKAYFIRTVTMNIIGRLEAVYDKELRLSDASWIADSGRFGDALKNGTLEEIEPFQDDVIIGRGSIIDATVWSHEIKLEQK